MTTLDNQNPFLTAKALCRRIVFSKGHLSRLQDQQDFPKPRWFSTGHRCWHVSDVNAWMQRHLDTRPAGWTSGPPLIVNDQDRFIDKHAVLRLVPYSGNYLWALEKEGRFPQRMNIGKRRAVWLEREVIAWLDSKKPEATAA